MSMRRNKKLWALVLVSAAGTVFGTYPSGCGSYFSSLALTGFNFCSVLNCESSTYFNFCQPYQLLADCPTTTTGA
jgi:hypothetical protein